MVIGTNEKQILRLLRWAPAGCGGPWGVLGECRALTGLQETLGVVRHCGEPWWLLYEFILLRLCSLGPFLGPLPWSPLGPLLDPPGHGGPFRVPNRATMGPLGATSFISSFFTSSKTETAPSRPIWHGVSTDRAMRLRSNSFR
jgi:hypothetical protein